MASRIPGFENMLPDGKSVQEPWECMAQLVLQFLAMVLRAGPGGPSIPSEAALAGFASRLDAFRHSGGLVGGMGTSEGSRERPMRCCEPRKVPSPLASLRSALLPSLSTTRDSLSRALLGLLLSILLAPSARALHWSVAAGAGASIPVGKGALQQGVSTGPSATAAVALALGRGFEIAGRIATSRFPRDDAGVLDKSGIEQRPWRILEMSGGALTLRQGQVDLRFFPSQGNSGAALHPFVSATAGLAASNLEDATFSYAYAGHTWSARVSGSQGTHFALGFGAGLRFDLSRRFRLLCDGRYEMAFQKDETLRSIPLRLELAVGG